MNSISNHACLKSLKSEISRKREQWRNIREIRLNKKDELLKKGLLIREIRKNEDYRGLKREQKRLSKEIAHLVTKYNRKLSHSSGS